MRTHTHKPGMTYITDPKYLPEDDPEPFRPMHIYAAWDDVTNQGRGVLVAGYDAKVPAAMKPIPPGTKFVIPKTVKELGAAGSALMAARYEADNALADAKRVALKAIESGVTEVDVANSLGVDRMTVRKWQGKR
jgi:hypothetical protein